MNKEDKLYLITLFAVIGCILAGVSMGVLNSHLDRQFKAEAIRQLKDNVSVHLNTKDLQGLLK